MCVESLRPPTCFIATYIIPLSSVYSWVLTKPLYYPMGNCFSRRATATVPSVPPPQPQEKAQSTRPTSVRSSDAAPTVPLTVSTKHGVVRRVRARVQSEHTAFSQRLRDGKDYPLPSSGGDLL